MNTVYSIIADKISYKAGLKKILNTTSLVLKPGEFVGILGGSGSGKTTLLNCLSGFRKHSSGAVLLNGIKSSQKEKIESLIGYVPQDDIVHKTLKITKALKYAALLRMGDILGDEYLGRKIDAILEQLELTEHKNKRISKLSGGQRKRVNIGMELLHSPQLFFLDEPTAGLDPALERQLMKLLKELTGTERTILVSTHLMQHVDLFDVLLFIHKGEMVYCGPSSGIESYFGVSDKVDLFEKIGKEEPQKLREQYLKSYVYSSFLEPRLRGAHVQ